MRSILAPVIIVILSAAVEGLASDGVLEINQTCAVQTGCFPDDPAGFPVTLSNSGASYRLSSTLVVPDANTDAIVFANGAVSNVTIDLGGFSIRGPVVCSGSPLACVPSSGTGRGIEIFGVSTTNPGVAVRNGSITGMGSDGLLLGERAEVTGLRVDSNGNHGIAAAAGSIVSNCVSSLNEQIGITTSGGSLISGNMATRNGSNGFALGGGSTVAGNVALSNEGEGIAAGAASVVSGNTAYSNGGEGLSVLAGVTVSGNSSVSNGGDGIATGAGSTVQGNTVRQNGGLGLGLGGGTAYHDNTLTNNADGPISEPSPGVNMGGNSCNGAASCP